jgi:hypothetical protein
MTSKWKRGASPAREEAIARIASALAKPERAVREFGRLIDRFVEEPALCGLRFPAGALAEAALALDPAAPNEKRAADLIERLLTAEFRGRARETFSDLTRRGRGIDDAGPYVIGGALIDGGHVAIWEVLLVISAIDALLELYVRGRLASAEGAAALRAELAAGAARAPFERFLAEDPRARALRAIAEEPPIERTLGQFMPAFSEADEIAIPIEAALRGPIESAKAARRRQALADLPGGATPEAEELAVLGRALAKDRERAVAAFRADLLERWDEAVTEPPPSGAGATRAERIFAALAALEVLPPERHPLLVAAYAGAPARAAEGATGSERAHLDAIFARPLDPEGYRLYAAALLARGAPARAASFARAAIAALGEDEHLRATIAAAEARGGGAPR